MMFFVYTVKTLYFAVLFTFYFSKLFIGLVFFIKTYLPDFFLGFFEFAADDSFLFSLGFGNYHIFFLHCFFKTSLSILFDLKNTRNNIFHSTTLSVRG